MAEVYEVYGDGVPVSQVSADARGAFITKTYTHLLGAILGFTGIEVMLFKSGVAANIVGGLAQSWYIVFGAFILLSWIATHVAHNARSLGMQYAALAGYVVLEAIFFLPILYIASIRVPEAISSAALVTILAFIGLTAIAFVTRKDFSFLGGLLWWTGVCAFLLIIASMIFGFTLGTWFSVGMVAFAGASILWDTSKVIHHYSEDRYVAASLELFASVALMFWYVLRLFMRRD